MSDNIDKNWTYCCNDKWTKKKPSYNTNDTKSKGIKTISVIVIELVTVGTSRSNKNSKMMITTTEIMKIERKIQAVQNHANEQR